MIPQRTNFVILLAILCASCAGKQESPLPGTIGALELVESHEGDRASEIINTLHEKIVSGDEDFVGRYKGPDGEAILYASVYDTPERARDAEARMISRISNGTPLFGHFLRLSVRDKEISMCLGGGHAHYFFAADDRLYWLTVDPEIAQQTAEEFVSIVSG